MLLYQIDRLSLRLRLRCDLATIDAHPELSLRALLDRSVAIIEANPQTGHRFATRTGLPSLTWRKYLPLKQDDKDAIADVKCAQCGHVTKVVVSTSLEPEPSP